MEMHTAKRVRSLNDRLRGTLNILFGDITLSPALQRLAPGRQAAVLLAVMDYEFPPLPDYPWFVDMHERGFVEVEGEYYYFGIQYLDPDSGARLDDPTHPGVKRRLHILSASDVEAAA